jgi:hypothetical protein
MSGTYNGGDFNDNNNNPGLGGGTYYNGDRWIVDGSTKDNGGSSDPAQADSGPSPVAPPATTTITFVGVAPQTFRCTAVGMKPNTQHWPYLLTLDVSADCAPIADGRPYVQGGALITDANGSLLFDYFFKPTHSPFQTRAVPNSSDQVAIIPVGQQQFRIASADGHSTASTFIESKPTT